MYGASPERGEVWVLCGRVRSAAKCGCCVGESGAGRSVGGRESGARRSVGVVWPSPERDEVWVAACGRRKTTKSPKKCKPGDGLYGRGPIF